MARRSGVVILRGGPVRMARPMIAAMLASPLRLGFSIGTVALGWPLQASRTLQRATGEMDLLYAIIGFGEVGSIFARDLHAAGVAGLRAFDTAAAANDRAAQTGYVTPCSSAAMAGRRC